MNRLKPLEHRIKAAFFWLFKRWLKRGQANFQPLDGTKLQKVLFLRPEKIGDMIISFPVFDGLHAKYPHIRISILGSPRNHAIIKSDPRFDRIFLYTKKVFKDIPTIIAMRREKYDCVVDMICDDSVTALFLSQICAPGKPRIGVGKVKYRDYYDFNYDHRMGNTGHIIENTLKLLEAFDIDSSQVSGYAAPYVDSVADERAEKFISGIADGDSLAVMVGYNLSAGSPTRVWAKEKSVELVRRLVDSDPGFRVILFTTPAERERGRKILERFDRNVCLVPDGLNLMEASAVLKRFDILISPDTSMVHIARAFRVDVVGLYSRFMKNFLLWKPYDQEVGAVVSGNDDNIHDITPEAVFDVFQQVLANRKAVARR